MRRSGMVHSDFIIEKLEIKSVRFVSNKSLCSTMLNDLHHQALVEFWDFVKFGYNEGQLALKKRKTTPKTCG